MHSPPRTEIVDTVLTNSRGRFDIDLAEKYAYGDINYANANDESAVNLSWMGAARTDFPAKLGWEQYVRATDCVRGLHREVKHYCATTPFGVPSEAHDELFRRFALCLNFMENVSGLRWPVDEDQFHDAPECIETPVVDGKEKQYKD